VAEELVKEVRRKVATYGEENNYVYIYGSNETANILYAKEGKDITEELIEYINK
jgi:outer membrane protein